VKGAGSTTARGRLAEQLVADHLTNLGFIVVARDLRVGRDEVDILAWEGATLVVVEVRSRRAGAMVDPLSSVSRAKQRRLRNALARCMVDHRARDGRIDVASVVGGALVDYVPNAIDYTET
jgi:putative endonuclease